MINLSSREAPAEIDEEDNDALKLRCNRANTTALNNRLKNKTES
jgi:hypothetical protein